MIYEFTKQRYKALVLLSEYLNTPPRELKLDAIITDIPEEDLRWVTERFHYYTLKLLEEVEDKIQREAEI